MDALKPSGPDDSGNQRTPTNSRTTTAWLARPDTAFAAWPFVVEGKAVTVRVAGDRVANDGGVLREWAVKGRGVIVKNRWDVRKEIESGALATALDAYVTEHVDLYAVFPGGIPSRRVGALIDFFAEELREPEGSDVP